MGTSGGRARAWGLGTYSLPSGPLDAITDVPGVRVGHATIRTPVGAPAVGRTGVTVVRLHDGDPWQERLFAASHVQNGYGQLTGRDVLETTGLISTPVFLTGTRSLGTVYEGAVRVALRQNPRACEDDLPIPVVGECDDSYLSDAAVTVGGEEVASALAGASDGPVEEGCVGAGTGMHLYGYKGGIGTASRVVAIGGEGARYTYTVGVLLLTNFGRPHQMRLGRVEPPGAAARDGMPPGSCIGLAVTDAPLHPLQLSRLAQRVGFGLVRTGSVGADGSGEIFLAVSTATRLPSRSALPVAVPVLVDGQVGEGAESPINDLFEAVIEAAEEAVWNALVAAVDMDGREGRRLEAFRSSHRPDPPSPGGRPLSW